LAARAVSATVIVAALSLCLPGCMTPREKMQETRERQSLVLNLAEILPKVSLAQGEDTWLLEMWRSGTQSVTVLMLPGDAVLERRYHETHDLTVVCVRGNAIVEVEGERQLARPPACVFLPRLTAYKILPHESGVDFAALLIYSPPFDGKDCFLLGE